MMPTVNEIARRRVTRGRVRFVVRVVVDGNARPSDYDCYTGAEIDAWADAYWCFAGVLVSLDGLPDMEVSVWAVQWSLSADSPVQGGWGDVERDVLPVLVAELRPLVEAERDALSAALDVWPGKGELQP